MDLFDYQRVMDAKLNETVTETIKQNNKEIRRTRLRWNRCFYVKSRQSSATSFVSFRCLYESLRNPGFNSIFFEPSETLVKTLSAKVRYAASLLPEKQVVIDNVSELKLKNQSTLFFRTAKAENASRGLPLIRYTVADECAFYGLLNQKDRLKSLIGEVSGASTLVPNIQSFYITTPNTPSDYYSQLLVELIGSFDKLQQIAIDVSEHRTYSEIPGFHYLEFPKKRTIVFFIHFSAHPLFRGLDIQKQLETFQAASGQTWEEVLREYHLRWLLEDYKQLIASEVIERQAQGAYEDEPDNQNLLVAGLDPSGFSNNENSDFTSLTILKIRKERYDVINQEVYDNESDIPVKIASILSVLKRYKIKYLAIETNGIGITYLQEIERQMLVSDCELEILKIHTSTNKRIAITSQLQLQLELGNLYYPKGSPIHKELPDLLRDAKGRITHSLHSHDDACFSTAFAIHYAQQERIRDKVKGLEFDALTEEEKLEYELEMMRNR